MTQFLPPNLLALFAPRDPLPFLPPTDKLPHDKKRLTYGGVADYLKFFEDPKDTPVPVKVETRDERQERKKKERAELQAYKIEQGIALWDPQSNSRSTSDPYKTLFVARINYDTSESKLRREFESYGPIKKIHLIYNKVNNKPKGYAFVEFEHERDMHVAYKYGDGKKVDGRRVLVDVERGRTVKGWLPRRFGKQICVIFSYNRFLAKNFFITGGGLGNTRRAKAPGGEPLSDSRGNSRRRRSRSRSRDRNGSSRRGGGDDRRALRSERGDRGDRDRDRERYSDRSRGGTGSDYRRDKDREDRGDRNRDRDKERDRGRDNRRGEDFDISNDTSRNYDENGQY
uniref:U1 small nuclear ribonucleoprotein 70 kDa n=1 Tax=Romanomermis culicivorax TaxID=13658 RepID=A0A915IUT2_ROMCU